MSKNMIPQTEEFRRETVRLLESSGKSVPQLAREMGINEKTLYRWRKQYGSIPDPSRTRSSKEAELEAENARLRRELKTVEQERDILKKAITIFSRSQP